MLVVIPARAGSKRVPNKSLRLFGDSSLLQWAIDRANRCGGHWIVAGDWVDPPLGLHQNQYWRRDPCTATDVSADYSWAKDLPTKYPGHDAYTILRLTSPFFTHDHVLRMMAMLTDRVDSVRAMARTTNHPAKMWTIGEEGLAHPVMVGITQSVPWHSRPTQTLPPVFQQTAACEVVWAETLTHSLAGTRIAPYIVSGPTALDINTPEDWARAEEIAKTWTTT
jgi:CMP-N-acetylneuraminic acid synthetase